MRHLVGSVINGAYKAIYGNVPTAQLPYNGDAAPKKKGGAKKGSKQQPRQYQVYLVKYSLGPNPKVLQTKGRKYVRLTSALKRINHLEDLAYEDTDVVLIRLWCDDPEKQVLQRKRGLNTKK